LFRAPVPKLIQLRKMMARVDIQQRHRNFARPKRLLRQSQQANRILPARKQKTWSLEFRSHFAHGMNVLRYKRLYTIEMISAHGLVALERRMRSRNVN